MTDTSSDMAVPDAVNGQTEGFGAILKKEREAQGISLGDMATFSRLSVNQLRALENEDIDQLPMPVYTRAFIRDVAKQLSIDPEPLVEDYVSRFGRTDAGQIPSKDPAGEVVISRRHEHRGLKVSGVALIAAILVLGGWGVYSGLLSSKTETAEPEATVTAEVQPSDTVTESVSAEVVPQNNEAGQTVEIPSSSTVTQTAEPTDVSAVLPKENEQAATVEPVVAMTEHQIVMKARRDVWIQIRSAEGKNLLAKIVKAGTILEMPVPLDCHFTIGNSEALEMMVDGEPRPLEANSRGIAKFILK